MKHISFDASSLYNSGRANLLELHGLYQQWDTTGSTSFSAFLYTDPSAIDTTSASMKQMFFNMMPLHENDH